MENRQIILVRHGQSQMNKLHLLAGRYDTDLTKSGYKQLKKTSKFIKKMYGADIIFSSPLKRALRSANIINAKLNCKIKIDDRLIETDFGKWEGKSTQELSMFDGWKEYSKDPFHFAFPEGESPQDVKKRILEFKNNLSKDNSWEKAIIVSHYTPLVFYILDILGKNDSPKAAFKLTHGALSIIEYKDTFEYIRCLNYLP